MFRRGVRWARAVVVLAAVTLPACLAGAARGSAAAPETLSAETTGGWLLFCQFAYGGAFVWSAAEGLSHYTTARRRVAIGLLAPAVANRFLLFAIYGLSCTGIALANAAAIVLRLDIATSLVVALVASAAMFLAILPLAWYLERLEGRSSDAARGAPVRVAPAAFRKLDLEAHTFLADVPLEDVSTVDLVGGGEGRGVADLRSLLASLDLRAASRATRFLFALRTLLGRLFGWDRDPVELPPESYIHRLTPVQRARSSVVPGTPNGGFRVVYVFDNEALSEIINATVHAFLCYALVSSATGYRLYWAVYVKPVSRWTSLYMTAIEPFRRFIVYPSILRRIERAWAAKYSATTVPRNLTR